MQVLPTVFVWSTSRTPPLGVTINEGADPTVCSDILKKLKQLVPPNDGYRHMEGNSDSHIKASIMGSSVTVLVEGGPSRPGHLAENILL